MFNGSKSKGASGLRRRHSSPEEEESDQEEPQLTPESIIHDTHRNARRANTDPLELASFISTINLAPGVRRRSDDPSIRARFSAEAERIPVEGIVDPKGFRNTPLAGRHWSTLSTSTRRQKVANLSLNTAQATTSSAILGCGAIQPPSSIKSSESPCKIRQPPPTSRTRNRGYSLRRTLFNRGTTRKVDETRSVIELQEAGPSNRPGASSATEYPSSKTKLTEATIIVSPAFDNTELPSYQKLHRKPRRFQGVSALLHYEQWIREKAALSSFISKFKIAYLRVEKFALRIDETPPSKDGRHIDVDATRKFPLIDERTGKPYISNTIRSSRYSIWNFVPKQLWFQFSKIANFYFLCVSVLQMIPGLSTTGTYTTIIPLVFFIGVSISKEGYDDLRRYRLDNEENNRETTVLHAYQPIQTVTSHDSADTRSIGPKHWATTKWKNIQVGDIIKLERDQAAPADLILLHSRGENGIAYIETMALDGETNLKSKQAAPSIARTCDTVDRLVTSNAHIVVEDPNLDLYNFEGRATAETETSSLSNGQVIYRGSILRNTPEAIGVVIYSGEECKIRMNASQNPRIKAPSLQATVNKVVIVIVIFVIILALWNTVAYQLWARARQHKKHTWYLTNAAVAFGQILTGFVIMFNTMIPLSLYVSLEIVKVLQMLLLNDIDMYDPVSETPLEARTSTINEELGQVSYIFSDKTGTLTDNLMKFRKLSVAGTAWLHDSDLNVDAVGAPYLAERKRSKGKKPAKHESITSHKSGKSPPFTMLNSPGPDSQAFDINNIPKRWKSSARPAKAQPELSTVEMLRYIQHKPFTVFAQKVRFFLLSLALCHTCLPETREDGTINFQAASPDELALVQAAQELGYLVIERQSGNLTVRTYPNGLHSEPYLETYEILEVIEFSSTRKKMSIVVKFPDQRICVFSKGADSTMMRLLKFRALAMQKTGEIERRASKRKSTEASQAMARRQEVYQTHDSVISPSLSAGRPSFGDVARSSLALSQLQPLRNQIDTWLTERETEVDASIELDETAHYTTRPSMQLKRQPILASGARSSYYEDLADDLVEESLVVDEPAVIERCLQHINDFASEGLRTLLYGFRFLEVQEYLSWKKIYQDATTSLLNRQELIEKAAELIEHDLELAGATAIEDKLQNGVPETIDKLRRAKIKIWMLTGDKRETAINIGHSCRLIKDYSTVTVLDHEDGEVEQRIASAMLNIASGGVAHSVVVVDGQTLSTIEADTPLKVLFVNLAIIADSVICCRASPSQKAGLVRTVRLKVKKSVTLAIGDGANDIAMIQEAHVGIGITGKEGLQAARTSDYSIAQFRFLTKLLLVHGRWNYIRTCKYTVGTFWKEMTFYLTQAMFQRYAGYTGTSLYESWSLSMFNTLFTSLPVIFIGVFEKDLAASTLLAVPELYIKGQHSQGFNFRIYAWWMFLAAADSVIIFHLMYTLFARGGIDAVNMNNDLFPMGDLCFTAAVILVSCKLQLLEMHNVSIANVFAVGVSVGGWFLWNILLAIVYTRKGIYDVRGGFSHRFGRDWNWWLTLIVILACLFVLEVGSKAIKMAFRPSDTDVFQALEQDGVMKRRFEKASALELQAGWKAQGRNVEGELELTDLHGTGRKRRGRAR